MSTIDTSSDFNVVFFNIPHPQAKDLARAEARKQRGGRPCPASAHSGAGARIALQTLTVNFRIADDSPAERSSTQVVGASVLR